MERTRSLPANIVKPDLYDAFSKGEWDAVERFFSGQYDVEAFTERLTESGETALLVAIREGRGLSFIQNLIDLLPPELLDLTDYDGNTALHTAVQFGDVETVQLIVNKNPKLLNFHNKNGRLPLQLAADRDESMASCLLPFYPAFESEYEGNLRSLANSRVEVQPLPLNDEPSWSQQLNKAVVEHKWQTIESLVNSHGTKVFTVRLNESGRTALLVAIRETSDIPFIRKIRDIPFIEKMVNWMPRELLGLTDYDGYTALHHAVLAGHEEIAKLLVGKIPELLNFYDKDCYLPIQLSSKEGHFEMTNHLLDKSINGENNSNLLKDEAGVRAMQYLVYARYFDLALKLFERKPNLALVRASELKPEDHLALENITSLELIAEDPAAFPSGTYFNVWKSFIYSHHRKIPGILWKVLEIVVPSVKTVRDQNLKHHDAIDLVRKICVHIKHFENAKASLLLPKPFLSAARNGIHEIVTIILSRYPSAVLFTDENKHSIFHLAVMYRNKKIFNIACEKRSDDYKKFFSLLDDKRNNILHLAGRKARQDRLDLRPRAILQMQSEVKWFKEIENLVTPLESKSMNEDKKTPVTVFSEEHADLAASEIQWVTGMATACSVAASLIATVAFASAITVPGGNEDSNGLPNFSSQSSFVVFAVSDALALFASITSVLAFLSIFTSRYGVNDFQYELPNRLIIGLISLFLSIMNLMIAFGSTLFLVFAKKNSLLLIPIIIFSCVPVILYAFLQLPSLLNMMKSTYGRELLHPM